MSHDIEHVFVYGTLRRGSWNNRLLHDAEFVGMAHTCDSFALYVDGLPYVVREPVAGPIVGEVYALPAAALPRLDALEGHPDLYLRERVAYRLDDGTVGEAWLYFYPRAEGTLVPSGDYFVWAAAQETGTHKDAAEDSFYFAYGADMEETQMRARCHEAVWVGAACLRDHALRVSPHGLLDLAPQAGEEVYGVVWRLSPEMFTVLERFQCADLGPFDVSVCEVALLTGGTCEARVYRGRDQRGGVRLRPAYCDKTVRAAQTAGLPAYYVSTLASLA